MCTIRQVEQNVRNSADGYALVQRYEKTRCSSLADYYRYTQKPHGNSSIKLLQFIRNDLLVFKISFSQQIFTTCIFLEKMFNKLEKQSSNTI